jgi:hypothetical protein
MRLPFSIINDNYRKGTKTNLYVDWRSASKKNAKAEKHNRNRPMADAIRQKAFQEKEHSISIS